MALAVAVAKTAAKVSDADNAYHKKWRLKQSEVARVCALGIGRGFGSVPAVPYC